MTKLGAKVSGAFGMLLMLTACDMGIPSNDPNRTSRRTPPQERSDVLPVDAVKDILRADMLRVVSGKREYLVHVAGVCAPSIQPGPANKHLEQSLGIPSDVLPAAGSAAAAFVADVVSNEQLNLVILGWRTNAQDDVLAEGDFIGASDMALSARLLEHGLAAVFPPVPRTSVDYEQIERAAQIAELGIWRHPVPVGRRVNAWSSFKVLDVSSNVDHVLSQDEGVPKRVLETHRIMRKRGEISISLSARKPLWQPYPITVRYAFRSTTMTGRPLQTDTASRKTAHTDTNATEATPRVLLSETRVQLASLATNIVIHSDIVEYSDSTKAGIDYTIGESIKGYDLEVWHATNLVYAHYHGRAGTD